MPAECMLICHWSSILEHSEGMGKSWDCVSCVALEHHILLENDGCAAALAWSSSSLHIALSEMNLPDGLQREDTE